MTGLRRHQLARLTDAGWDALMRRNWDTQASACLAHWAAHHLPLVVARQPEAPAVSGRITMGLAAPERWDRRRIALHVPIAAVLAFDEFPLLTQVQSLLPALTCAPVRELLVALDLLRADVRVFGSYGWQALTGLDHVRPGSDIDLWVGVEGIMHADAVAHVLQTFSAPGLRLDGELVFSDGAAVAWREWNAWRRGHANAVIVKHLGGPTIQRDLAWCPRPEPAESAP
ncbi:MAG: malonate decarboxylase holo-[acyl-carrier-protein] synthase [Proteobacteria bacterium]|nr:malonate decarboxylase holo-[acyl-carrier-protein] synthase [Pseudomonadota bacterium]